MKKYIFLFISIVFLASCSSPKYTYYFGHYDYNSGKKKVILQEQFVSQSSEVTVPEVNLAASIDEKTVVASTKDNEVYMAKPAPTISKEEAVAKIKSLSKEEKKQLKQEVKRWVKENRMMGTEVSSTRAMENDVKLAAIFGAAGLVLIIIGGSVLYVIGAIALLIGLYFFIRWLIHQ